MPTWTEPELIMAAEFMYKHVQQDQVRSKFVELGGVARGVLAMAGDEKPLVELRAAIRRVTVDDVSVRSIIVVGLVHTIV